MSKHSHVVPGGDRDRPRRTVSILILALLIVTITIQVGGFVYTGSQHDALHDLRREMRGARDLQQALFEAEDSVSDFVRSGEEEHLQRYYFALGNISPGATANRNLDHPGSPPHGPAYAQAEPFASGGLAASWGGAIRARREGDRARADAVLQGPAHRELLAARRRIDTYLAGADREAAGFELRDQLGGRLALVLQLVGGLLTLAVLVLGFRATAAEARARKAAADEALAAHDRAVAAHDQVERLFRMTDMLQSAAGHADANAVLKATAGGLLPDMGCSLHVFNNPRDRLDLSCAWNLPDGAAAPDAIAPPACWALKRGKPHLNSSAPDALRCEHDVGEAVALEIPMMAKGEVYGLLSFFASGPEAAARLEGVASITTALADAMSLALSNIALREKLRNQALKDSLTGLYNRRYLEDVIERFARLAERHPTQLAAIMVDLDHFKRLNDSHGHAVGDAVLRDCAEAILGGLRQSDIACRYGGEELTILLPETSLEEAMAKAEMLRGRIEALSDVHDARVTASMGVAACPETTASVAALLTFADAALYEAKSSGRNRVIAAGVGGVCARSGLPEVSLVQAAE